ncbi:GTP-binding protein [Paenibacillus sp. FSL R7-0273]|uniref:putative glycoside hydrolase n=1 Tax=Paenibacillus sp. FSL R7-0273 TaxID=1536772 RepID=UPI0004F859EA|nr:putative glycoside hydrolase [Paenibacillus sp. FSL R7-0273]AIQ46422.1 GTP-binding protein [Paenibacillus sp. FSL R7-0273]OMF86762.1 GTP-binding protein [Paenibacillus sp. FSL R7-0273]
MNITWALLMMALGGVGVQHTGHEADVSAALQSAANPPITAAGQSGTSGPNTAAGNPAQSPAPSAAPGAADSALHTDPQPDAPKVKGIYVTAYSAGGERMEQLLGLLDKTELNSMVIDIKDDAGYITYKTDNAELQEMGTPQKFIGDINKLMTRLKEHDVYPIARIVVFKDSVLAKKHPELSFVNSDGSVWKNKGGDSFVNPYNEDVWKYNVDIAKEAAKLGFKEIQFDYVRFPEGFEKRADTLKYTKSERPRVEIIADFVKYAKAELAPLGVRISVDIFGYAASVPAAEGIGQDFVKISKNVDVISPMVYPSHYSTGWFDVKDPDKDPYATIKGSMVDTHKKLDPLGSYKPVIRPWIQDFTASWLGSGHFIKYGKQQVEDQIRALKDENVDEFLLWNANNRYTSDVDYEQ